MVKKIKNSGQILVGVLIIVLVLLIIIPAMVQWLQQESRTSVKVSRSTNAFNLANAALERGYWKVKSSTGTASQALSGTAIAGYEFDTTYNDVSGGTYRIQITSATGNNVVIVGEGRDLSTNEVRAVSGVYKNQAIYSPALAKGVLTWGQGLGIFWGPIFSQGDINLNSGANPDVVANWYFPRKYSAGVVYGTALNPRDTNGLLPPNTDGVEWWSGTNLVPELPVLDFAALRSSAVATNTLNVYGCKSSTGYTNPANGAYVAGAAPWDGRGGGACANAGAPTHTNLHFSASYNHVKGTRNDPNNSYVWFWDGDVVLGGDTTVNGTYGIGLRGSVVVKGNLTLDANGDYNYTGNVPVNAWAEFNKLSKTANDTAAVNEYPADNGFHKSLPTWAFGTTSFNVPTSGSFINTVGVRGFVYVGGNLTITNNGFMDINGALWVNGNTIATGANNNTFCGIYFDDNLNLPTLNVILIQQSFQEVSPSPTVWP